MGCQAKSTQLLGSSASCSETGSFIDGPHNGVQRVLSWCPSNAACSVIFSVKTTELPNGTPDGSMDLALDEFIPFHTGH